MSDIFDRLRSGAGKVAKEADKAVDIKRIELQIGTIKKKIEEEYQKLGRIVYEATIMDVPENPEHAEILSKITELKQQVEVKEDEIKVIKGGTPDTAVASQDKMVCNNCGGENDANSMFCSSCGTKMSQ